MKTITNMSLLKKVLIITIVIITLFNFTCPTIVFADDEEDDVEDIGGVLFYPIQALVRGLGDVCMWILNKCTDYDGDTILDLETSDAWREGVLSFLIPGIQLANNYDLYFSNDKWPNSLELPIFKVTPEKIFSNQVPLFDVNIMNPSENSIASDLQSTISKWYNALKNLAIVGLLIVLVYIAIRMIISSTASDKSKYKQMFMDWIVAFCLIFFMHYIMSFSITIVQSITSSLVNTNELINLPIPNRMVDEYTAELDQTDEDDRKTLEAFASMLRTENGEFYKAKNENGEIFIDDNGNCYYMIQMDFTSYARYKIQSSSSVASGRAGIARSGMSKMSYTIIYAVLVVYTVMFSFGYLKRFVYLTYLTMIAPLVALTYPIDKIKDGKAQGFNTWLKEYLYNLIIQPVHLILYIVLVGSAMELATKYFIYPLVVLGFLLQAEKIIRKLFGFENSSTASAIANGALGGALVMQGINSLSKIGKSKSGKESSEESTKIRYNNRKADDPEGINNLIGTTFAQNANRQNANRQNVNRQNANRQNPNAQNVNGQNPNGQNPNGQSANRQYANGQNANRQNINGQNVNGQNVNNQNTNRRGTRQQILDEYESAGYSQNANGEYYNPWTQEYDPNYSPFKDQNFGGKTDEEILKAYESEGYSQNANGEYYNPWTEEYDSNYSPLEDQNYMFNQGQNIFDENEFGEEQYNYDNMQENHNDNNEQENNVRYYNDDGYDNSDVTYRNTYEELNNLASNVENNNNSDSSKPKFFSGVKGVVGHYVKPKTMLKGAAKGAVKVIGAGTLGTIGVAAGLASDNFANVAKYGIGAGAVGAIAGKKVTNLASNAYKKAGEVRDVYEENAYSKEAYKKLQNERADKAFMKDEKVIEQYRKAFKGKKNGEEAYKVAMKKAMQYRKQGITDNDVIIKAMKANVAGINDDWDDNRRIVAAKLATQGDVNNEKGIQDIKNRLVAKNVQENDAENYVQLIREIKDLF